MERKPPLPSHERDLLRLYPSSEAKRVKANETIESTVEALKLVRTRIKALEQDKAQCEFDLKSYLGEFEVLVNKEDAPLVTWKSSKPGQRFDEKRFAAEHPELYQQYRRELPGSRRFLVK